MSRYHDVAALFRQPGASSERPWDEPPDASTEVREAADAVHAHLRTWLLMVDPPDHTRSRKLVSAAFTRRIVESLRPRIEGLVQELLGDVRPGDEIDLIDRLAYPLPTRVIAELIGLPLEHADRFKRWSDDIAAALSDALLAPDRDDIYLRTQSSVDAVGRYLREQIALRRRPPRREAPLFRGLLPGVRRWLASKRKLCSPICSATSSSSSASRSGAATQSSGASRLCRSASPLHRARDRRRPSRPSPSAG